VKMDAKVHPVHPNQLKPGTFTVTISEESQVLSDWEHQLEQEFAMWGHDFMAWARECGAVVDDVGLDYAVRLDKLTASMAAGGARGKVSGKHKALLAKFWSLVDRSAGYMASCGQDYVLRLAKPGSAWVEGDLCH